MDELVASWAELAVVKFRGMPPVERVDVGGKHNIRTAQIRM